MKRFLTLIVLTLAVQLAASAQSGRASGYSESRPARITGRGESTAETKTEKSNAPDDVVRVPTDLVMIPVRVATRDGKPVSKLTKREFQIFENGAAQEIAYFSDQEQPFTVALVLDMSYSSVFKLEDIQLAARIFVSKLRDHDRVTVISFDERPQVLCEATNDRRILRLAIDGARIASGTAVYDTLDMTVRKKLADVPGRKAIVLLSDGVDTASELTNAKTVLANFAEEGVIVYPIRYDTFDDVQKSRKKDAEIRYDDDDRRYVVHSPLKKGERQQDYQTARKFLDSLAGMTGGRVYDVSSTTNLNDAFSNIADELRRTYSIGYYPAEDRQSGAVYDIKVRVYRPNLKITARNQIIDR